MTEWERSQFLRKQTSERKLRLFAADCLTAVADRLTDPRTATAVEVLNSYLDDRATVEQLEDAYEQASEAIHELAFRASRNPRRVAERFATEGVLAAIGLNTSTLGDAAAACLDALPADQRPAEDARQAALLNCVFGPPVAFDPRWRTETAVALANGVYQLRAFDRLPVLADALQDAGCNDADVLTHLRHPGPHARGCWVVDLVLNRS